MDITTGVVKADRDELQNQIQIPEYSDFKGNHKLNLMALTKESCLFTGMHALITISVASRTSVSDFNSSVVEYFAYSLAYITLVNLIVTPFELLRLTKYLHKKALKTVQENFASKVCEIFNLHDKIYLAKCTSSFNKYGFYTKKPTFIS